MARERTAADLAFADFPLILMGYPGNGIMEARACGHGIGEAAMAGRGTTQRHRAGAGAGAGLAHQIGKEEFAHRGVSISGG